MIGNLAKILVLLFILFFFSIVLSHYFSEKNVNLVINNRKILDSKTLEKVDNLPILLNDTKNVIEFNTSFEKLNKQNYKRNFWELFK